MQTLLVILLVLAAGARRVAPTHRPPHTAPSTAVNVGSDRG